MNAEEVRRLLKHKPIIWKRQDLLNHMTNYRFKQLISNGELQRIRTGCYVFRDAEEPDSDIVLAQQFFPKAIVSVFSAANFYDLTTVIPRNVQLTLPSTGTRQFVMPGYPPIEFFFTSEKTMDLGGQKVEIDGQEVKIYNRERTVCDMFRYMDRTGIDAAIEVFKNYMSDKQGRNIPVLWNIPVVCAYINISASTWR